MKRFWDKVQKTDTCWWWLKGKNSHGYGEFYYKGKRRPAHVFAWELENGPMPAGLKGCHTCDNPGCVRPAHIFAGTQSQNLKDCVAKGRHPSRAGTLNGKAILTEKEAAEIRKSGDKGVNLAAKYSVSAATVSMIRSGKTWGHVK